MGASKKHVNHTSGADRQKKKHQIFFFFRQTQLFSTDVLQHEYIIYIFIYFIHTFSKLDQKSIMGCYKVNSFF